MKYLSVCSGIEAASVAWHPLGWRPVAFSEIDPFACAVLAHRYPGVPNWGDMTRFQEWPDATVDVLVGGTPCQSFSVAGLRAGLADPRGNLALTYLAIAQRCRPEWLVWENVPGVLSSSGGRDFGAFLGALGELGYGWAYRCLDAQYFGLAQRRNRVFVVGCLGGWERAAAVLFDAASLRGDPPPRRSEGEGVARPLAACVEGSSGYRNDADTAENLIPQIARCVTAREGSRQDYETETLVAHTLRAEGFDATPDPGRGTPIVPVAFDWYASPAQTMPCTAECPPLRTTMQPAVAFHENQRGELTLNDTAGSLKVGGGKPGQGYPAVHAGMQVRRLTPTEAERLQGFPDGWTAVPYRNKPAADGPRYRALGNSMAVPVVRWIGERIEMVERLAAEIAPEAAA